MSPEGKEITEKRGVVFIIFKDNKIQLEERIEPGRKFSGFTIIPGGGIESGEKPITTLCREVIEEYGVLPLKFKEIGKIVSTEVNGLLNTRYVYLVTEWLGILGNPENKNRHLESEVGEARTICKHEIPQQVLDLLDSELLTSTEPLRGLKKFHFGGFLNGDGFL